MSIGSSVIVPPVMFGGFNSIRGRLGSGTPSQIVSVGIDQRLGVGVAQTPVAVGIDQREAVVFLQSPTEKGEKSGNSRGVIIGGQTTVIAPEGEQITQYWSG
ncbi:MAG: hypothetical protein HQL95_05290 [Magnetococcales bacterium]|nr:hypothetical protein [Magnetococcales bacterium]